MYSFMMIVNYLYLNLFTNNCAIKVIGIGK